MELVLEMARVQGISGPFKDLAYVSTSFMAKSFFDQMWKFTNEACKINNDHGVFYKSENQKKSFIEKISSETGFETVVGSQL